MKRAFALLFVMLLLVSVLSGCSVFQRTYTSTAKVYVYPSADSDPSRNTVNYTELYKAEQLSGLFIEILKSDNLLKKAIAALDPPQSVTPKTIRDGVKITTDDNNVIKISLRYSDPEGAQMILQKMLELYPEEVSRLVKGVKVEILEEPSLPR